jgi:hypothetical protein
VIDAWADTSREMILGARKVVDEVLCVRAEEAFEMGEWVEIWRGMGRVLRMGRGSSGLWRVLVGVE